jgi:hypothetical protein
MAQYGALYVFIALMVCIFVVGLLYGRYRKDLMRKLNLRDYRPKNEDSSQEHRSDHQHQPVG